jgi:RNA polymerase sigma-70 factor (ECF subfamily)
MRREDVETTFERYGPMVLRRARAILGNDEEARDVMQDVFIKILTGGMKSEGPVSAWLARVTTNACINRIRDKNRRSELLRQNFIPGERSTAGLEDRVIVRNLLAEVDDQVARAAVCVHLDGMTQEETAAQLGVSLRTVANLLNRFKQRSLEVLEPKKEEREERR